MSNKNEMMHASVRTLNGTHLMRIVRNHRYGVRFT